MVVHLNEIAMWRLRGDIGSSLCRQVLTIFIIINWEFGYHEQIMIKMTINGDDDINILWNPFLASEMWIGVKPLGPPSSVTSASDNICAALFLWVAWTRAWEASRSIIQTLGSCSLLPLGSPIRLDFDRLDWWRSREAWTYSLREYSRFPTAVHYLVIVAREEGEGRKAVAAEAQVRRRLVAERDLDDLQQIDLRSICTVNKEKKTRTTISCCSL